MTHAQSLRLNYPVRSGRRFGVIKQIDRFGRALVAWADGQSSWEPKGSLLRAERGIFK